ncbi:MAG: hypothetical protein AAF968_27530 [Pseudomonadota bacterium]
MSDNILDLIQQLNKDIAFNSARVAALNDALIEMADVTRGLLVGNGAHEPTVEHEIMKVLNRLAERTTDAMNELNEPKP